MRDRVKLTHSAMKRNKDNSHTQERDTVLRLPLKFDEVLDGLLQIKPVDNAEAVKPKPKQKSEAAKKKKSKPKTVK